MEGMRTNRPPCSRPPVVPVASVCLVARVRLVASVAPIAPVAPVAPISPVAPVAPVRSVPPVLPGAPVVHAARIGRRVREPGHRTAARPLALALALAALAACRPELGLPPHAEGGGGSGGGSEPELVLVPSAALDDAPLAVRAHLDGAVDPDDVWFLEGTVGPGHLRQLLAGTPSGPLTERRRPATVWTDADGVWVAPHALLEPAREYALAVADRGVAHRLVATAAAAGPVLRRAWPPADTSAAVPRVVLCGEADLPAVDVPIVLAPGSVEARAIRGASSAGGGRRCLRVVAAMPVPEGSLHAPPSLTVDGIALTLDPTPIHVGDDAPTAATPLACEPDEVRIGLGCARVADDRATVRTPPAPLFWVVAGASVEHVVATAPGEPFVVPSLRPATEHALDVSVADAAGREEVTRATLVTSPPRAHVVISEVLADPVAPDATSEWIELVNDGSVAADLGGLRILDVGGEIALPPVPLAPGAYAVVVDADWVPDAALDPVPVPGALVIRVSQLGRGGLANGGELLRLVDDDGTVLSAVPAIAAAGAGTSTARREPWLADAPSSFMEGTPTPGSPNAPAPPDR